MEPRVLNSKTATAEEKEGAVYIGRPSKWGNPFHIGRDGDRMDVVYKYFAWLLDRPDVVKAAKEELKGKNLICFCKPDYCHGDILLQVANGS